MSDANLHRQFRERVPQPKSTDACPNYCHNETSRKVTQRFQWDLFGDSIDPLVRWPTLTPIRGQSKNAILGADVDPTILSRTDRRRRPWSNTGALTGTHAVGGGAVFEALRITDRAKGTTVAVTLQWESQDFSSAATLWEKRYSPLVKSARGSQLTPIVDADGYVVAYTGRTHPSHLWRAADQSITYLPDVSGSAVNDRQKAQGVRRDGKDALGGGDYAIVLVNVDGEVLHHVIGDYALEPPDFWPSVILSMGGTLLFGLAKAGVRTLVVSAIKRGTARALRVFKGTVRSGKFVEGTSEKISLYHGTTHTGRVAIEKGGLVLRKGAGAADDFGDGFYMTLDSRVAQQTSAVRTFSGAGSGTTTTTAVMHVEIEAKQLGKIVDIRPGGMHRELWEKYLDEPLVPGSNKTIGWLFETGQDRGRRFQEFLKKHRLEEADTIIGPLGDKYTSGLAALRSGDVSNQLVLRSQMVMDRVAKVIQR